MKSICCLNSKIFWFTILFKNFTSAIFVFCAMLFLTPTFFAILLHFQIDKFKHNDRPRILTRLIDGSQLDIFEFNTDKSLALLCF